MSVARVTTVTKARKDQGKCGKCGTPLPAGSAYRHFAVGFRGYKQVRCTNPACTPSTSELESSAVAAVYAAIESVDFSTCETTDDFTAALQEVADAAREVAEEYESNEMYEINEQLQERADMLNGAADELEVWSPDEDEPDADDFDWDEPEPEKDDFADLDDPDAAYEEALEQWKAAKAEAFQEALDEWREATAEAAQDALNDMELP